MDTCCLNNEYNYATIFLLIAVGSSRHDCCYAGALHGSPFISTVQNRVVMRCTIVWHYGHLLSQIGA